MLAHPEQLDLRGLHSHIGSQIFEVAGFEVAARRLVGLHVRIATEHGHLMPEMDLGGGYGMSYTSQHHPLTPPSSVTSRRGRRARAQAAARRHPRRTLPRVSIEPGRSIVGPSTFTLYEVGTVKAVEPTRARPGSTSRSTAG